MLQKMRNDIAICHYRTQAIKLSEIVALQCGVFIVQVTFGLNSAKKGWNLKIKCQDFAYCTYLLHTYLNLRNSVLKCPCCIDMC